MIFGYSVNFVAKTWDSFGGDPCWVIMLEANDGLIGDGFNRFAPDIAPLRCALPGGCFGLALDAVVGRLSG
jgi:hypothetical protein